MIRLGVNQAACIAFVTLIVALNAHHPKASFVTTIVVANEAKTTKKAAFRATLRNLNVALNDIRDAGKATTSNQGGRHVTRDSNSGSECTSSESLIRDHYSGHE